MPTPIDSSAPIEVPSSEVVPAIPAEVDVEASNQTAVKTRKPDVVSASFQPGSSKQLWSGLHLYWDGNYKSASQVFESTANANPNDSMPRYFLALSQRRLGNTKTAGKTLNAAVNVEQRFPVARWGFRMQRIQGAERLWIEKARRDAGVIQ